MKKNRDKLRIKPSIIRIKGHGRTCSAVQPYFTVFWYTASVSCSSKDNFDTRIVVIIYVRSVVLPGLVRFTFHLNQVMINYKICLISLLAVCMYVGRHNYWTITGVTHISAY